MKVLVVSEGPHERSGALQNLARRLAEEIGIEFESIDVKADRVSRNDIFTFRGKGQGFFKRAVRWLLEAEKRGFDALILVIDEDGRVERRLDVEKAQENTTATIRRALGVAIRSFDAWMLADEESLSEVLRTRVARQPNPETIEHPKKVCQALLRKAPVRLSLREMYALIAQSAALDVLRKRCPKGFAPFAHRVRKCFDRSAKDRRRKI
jgi:hypothetical protein